jgi:hypothetical protein
MSTIKKRLAQLEAKAMPPAPRKWHRVIGDTDAECEAQRRAMIESGQAREGDNFIFRIIVNPGDRHGTERRAAVRS